MQNIKGSWPLALLLVACSGAEGVVDLGATVSHDFASTGGADLTMTGSADLTMTGPVDMAVTIDLNPGMSPAPDLVSVAVDDLRAPRDLEVARDLTVSRDLESPPDLEAPPDLRLPPDLRTVDMAVTPTAVDFTSPVGSPYKACLLPHAIGSGDFNGDGKPDLVTACINSAAAGVLLNNGDGTFAPIVLYPTDSWTSALTIGDFNGDHVLDVVVVNSRPNMASSTVSLLQGKGDGTFMAAVTTPSYGQYAGNIASADFNGDGNLDIAVIEQSTFETVVIPGLGNGGFAKGVHTANAYGADIVTADFDGDGKPDLAEINDGGQITVYLGMGDGTFHSLLPYGVGKSGAGLRVAGDLDGNGTIDLVAALNTDQLIGVLLGNRANGGGGDGTFRGGGSFALGGQAPKALAIADWNGDGKLDVTTVDTGSNAVAVLLGDGTGAFQVTRMFTVGASPSSITTADFNGDGKPDVAVANQTDGTITILLEK